MGLEASRTSGTQPSGSHSKALVEAMEAQFSLRASLKFVASLDLGAQHQSQSRSLVGDGEQVCEAMSSFPSRSTVADEGGQSSSSPPWIANALASTRAEDGIVGARISSSARDLTVASQDAPITEG